MRLFTLTVLFSLTASTTFSQEPEKVISGSSLKQIEKPKSELKTTHKNQELTPVDKSADQQQYPIKLSTGVRKKTTVQPTEKKPRTIQDIDREIESINSKMDIVVNDPEEDAIAKEQGWYDLMNTRLENLNKEKEEILKSK